VQKKRSSPWIRRGLVFVACAVLLDSLIGDHGLAETMRAQREYSRANTDLVRLQHENAALREKLRRLATDPAAIEAVARQELGLIRPGEILVVLKNVK
jgi:cell division protein FtsB